MKKLTAMLAAVAVMTGISCQTVTFAAFNDVADNNPYRKAITTLSKLSVINGFEDGTFKPDNSVTRAEFSTLVVNMLNLQNQSYANYTFADSSEHWAKNYIQTGYNLGIIAGFEDGTFRPDEPVTYEQALKMIDCTLGYDSLAQNRGGWPTGYIQQASELGLDKNVSGITYTANAPRGIVAQTLYNALEVEMYESNGYSWVKTEKTLLNDYLKVKELKGTLVGVEDTVTADCTHNLLEGEMDIKSSSGEEYVITYTSMTENISDIKKYLGNTITVYYRQPTSKDQRMLVIIDDETTKNTAYELRYDEIDSYSNNTLKYFEDNSSKAKTLKFREEDFTVRYNGKLVDEKDNVPVKNKANNTVENVSRDKALELWLNPDTDYSIYGTVKLTDSSNNSSINMIQIYDYQTMVAYAAPSTSDYRVTDKLVTGNSLLLDPQAANYTYTITKNGEEIPATSIAANDVILYAESLDQSVLTLLVSNKNVKGSISSMSSDGKTMNIGGTSYEVSPKCVSYVKDKHGKDLKSGVSGTFYLDALGTAVFATVEQTAVAPYAYIANAYLAENEDGKAYLSVYSTSTSGNVSSYPVKDKVKFNGSTINSELVLDKLEASSSYANPDEDLASKIYGANKTVNITPYSQPARITIKNGTITEIVTMEADELQSQNEDNEKLVRCKELDQYRYSSNGFVLDNKTAFTVNSSTIVLCPPADRSQRDKYAKKTPSGAFSSGDSYYVEAYDINSSKVAGLVILYGSDGTLTKVKKDTDFSVVAKLPETTYDDDHDKSILQLEVFAGTASAAKVWKTFDDKEFRDVQVGDVIQFSYDSDQFAQERINNIRYSDIEEILDGKTYDGKKFNWQEEQTPSEDNNYQSYKFDYRFKKAGTDEDEIYNSTSLGSVPYSRACMYNVSQVLLDDKKLYVTKNGFDSNEDLDDSDYEEINIQSSTKIVRMNDSGDEISKFVQDTTTPLTINDFKDAKNYGINCSKILVCSSKNNAKLIVIYQ